MGLKHQIPRPDYCPHCYLRFFSYRQRCLGVLGHSVPRYGFFSCCYIRTLAVTAILRQKKHPPEKVLDMWSESVTRTSREVYLSLSLWLHIAIEWVPNPIVKDPSESLVDRVLRSIFNEANQNPVAMVQKVLIKPSHRSETAVQYYYSLGVPPFHSIRFFSCWCCL